MSSDSKEDILNALKILQKYNFKEAEQALKQEAGLINQKAAEEFLKFKAQIKDEPESFGNKYQVLLSFIDTVHDEHKLELSSLLYPIFVHLYLRLICGNLVVEVVDGPPRSKLQIDCRRGALFGEARCDANKESVLYGLLRDPMLESSNILDTDQNLVSGDSVNPDNNEDGEEDQIPTKKKKRRDGFISGSTGTSSILSKNGSKVDSNSPSLDRIPLSKLCESVIESKKALAREISTVLRGYKQQNSQNLPSGTSAVLYTICNAQAGESALAIRRGGVTCTNFSYDSALLAAGFGSGRIRIWSLGSESLRRVLPASELNLLDKDDSRVKMNMLYDENDEAHPTRDLLGHVGSVHGVAFSPDRQLVVSAGSDGTVRLWSTILWGGALTAWRDHLFPVWCVTWAPTYGHYIVTGGADRTAHLYATDHAPDALRVFVGHKADVTSVCMHPNVNYLATGSADRAVRLFDVRSGKLVRLYTGHKGSVQSLAFSPCGRYLASGGWCGAVCLWDLGSGHQIGQLGGYSATSKTPIHDGRSEGTVQTLGCDSSQWLTGPVVGLAFCPANSGRLAACGLEGALRIWNTVNDRSSHLTNPTYFGLNSGGINNNNKGQKNNLLALHRLNKQQLVHKSISSSTKTTSVLGNLKAMNYYSTACGTNVSDRCVNEIYFTRRTSLLGIHYVHPYLLLGVGPYNQT